VLGQNSLIIEYKKDDVGCVSPSKGMPLEISVVKASGSMMIIGWPDPVVIRRRI